VNYEIVTLEERLVGGLTVPLSGNRITRRDLDLVNFTWDRYRQREDPRPRVAAYVKQPERGVAVLGYGAKALDDVVPGDVFTRIPAGRFARFAVSGKPYDLLRTAWADVVRAEREGRITRNYAFDLEYFDDPSSVEVFVSLA